MSEAKEEKIYLELKLSIVIIRDHFISAAKKIKALRDAGNGSRLDDKTLAVPAKLAEMIAELIPKNGTKILPDNKTWKVVKNYREEIACLFEFGREMKKDKHLFEAIQSDSIYYHYCKLCQNLYTAITQPISVTQLRDYMKKEFPGQSQAVYDAVTVSGRSYLQNLERDNILSYLSSDSVFGKGIKELAQDAVEAAIDKVDEKMADVDEQMLAYTTSLLDEVRMNKTKIERVKDHGNKTEAELMEELGRYILSSDHALSTLTHFDLDQQHPEIAEHELEMKTWCKKYFDQRSKTLPTELEGLSSKVTDVLARLAQDKATADRIKSCEASKQEYTQYFRSLLERIDELEKVVLDLNILQRGLTDFNQAKHPVLTVHPIMPKEPKNFEFVRVQPSMQELVGNPKIEREFLVLVKLADTLAEQLDGRVEASKESNKLVQSLLGNDRFKALKNKMDHFVKLDEEFDFIDTNYLTPSKIAKSRVQFICDNVTGHPNYKGKIKEKALGIASTHHEKKEIGVIDRFGANIDAGHSRVKKEDAGGVSTFKVWVKAGVQSVVKRELDERLRWDKELYKLYQYDRHKFYTETLRPKLAECLMEKINYYHGRIHDYQEIDNVKTSCIDLIKQLKQVKNSVYFNTDKQRQQLGLLINDVKDFLGQTIRWIFRLIEKLAKVFKIREEKLPNDLIAIRAARQYQQSLIDIQKSCFASYGEHVGSIDEKVGQMVHAQLARTSVKKGKAELQERLGLFSAKGVFGKGRKSKDQILEVMQNSDLDFMMRDENVEFRA